MKKTTLIGIFIFLTNLAIAQDYYMATPDGFAKGTTGNTLTPSTSFTTVTNYSQFKAALTGTTPIIIVSGVIDCPFTKAQIKDKTIIGLPGATLRNTAITPSSCATSKANSGILYIQSGSNNIIIRNLIFQGPGAFDVNGEDSLTNEGTNVWVDHCEFQDGMDGNFDIKGDADKVTVSWCKFTYLKAATSIPTNTTGCGTTNDHRFSDLIGSDIADTPNKSTTERYSVTFKNCYWAEGCKERMPRARNAEINLVNCYFKTSVAGSKAVILGAGNNGTTCHVKNCNFEKITTIYSLVTEGSKTVGVIFKDCIKGSPSTSVTGLDSGTATDPGNTSLFSAANVASFVGNTTCGAGAKLNVTSTGVISSSCPNGTAKKINPDLGNFYTSQNDNTLNIDLDKNVTGNITIEIYSLATGQKVYSSNKNITSSEKVSVRIDNLATGIYICNIDTENESNTWKFIKK